MRLILEEHAARTTSAREGASQVPATAPAVPARGAKLRGAAGTQQGEKPVKWQQEPSQTAMHEPEPDSIRSKLSPCPGKASWRFWTGASSCHSVGNSDLFFPNPTGAVF